MVRDSNSWLGTSFTDVMFIGKHESAHGKVFKGLDLLFRIRVIIVSAREDLGPLDVGIH